MKQEAAATPTLSSISISGNSSVNSSGNATYSCTATMSNGGTKTVTPTWSIYSGGSYAEISSSGTLTAYSTTSSQSVTIKASYTEGGVTKTATKAVTVNAASPVLSSISISGSSSVNSSGYATYSCTATMSDGSTKSVSPTWLITSGADYASINSSGTLTANSTTTSQSVTIKASYTEGGVTKTATKTITIIGSRQPYTLTCNPDSGTLNGKNFGADNGTSNPHDVTVVYGAGSYSALGRAVRSGYKFLGWYTSDGTQVYGLNGVFVEGKYWNASGQWQYAGNVTIYARWEKETRQTYTLTFNPNGGKLNGSNFGTDNGTTSSHAVTVVLGAGSYSSIGTATKDGGKFLGWYTSASGGTQVYSAGGVYVAGTYWNASGQWQYSGNLTVYARWEDPLSAALDNSSLVFTTGGNSNWISQTVKTHDGADAARSGKLGDSQTSWLQTTVSGPGTISFWWYVSCEGDNTHTNWDYLAVLVDGVEKARICGTGNNWANRSYSIPSGSHTVRWQYRKDGSDFAGEDAGFVDQVTWMPRQSYTLTCNPNSGTLNGKNFGADNGTTNPHDVTVVSGAGSYSALGRAVRSGYKFLGWYTSDGTQVYGLNGVYVEGKYWNSSGQWKYLGNVTIYARWEKETRQTYTLTFNPNGGKLNGTNFGTDNGTTSSHSVTVVLGAGSYSSIGTATKASNKFLGWYTSDGVQVYGLNGVYIDGKYWNASGQWRYSGDVTVYARWSAVTANNVLTYSSRERMYSSSRGTSPDSAKSTGKVVVKSVEAVYDGTVRWNVEKAPFCCIAGDMLRVTVGRVGGSEGRIAVKAETEGCQDAPDLTAIIGEDLPYVGEILVWSDGETADKVIEIPTFHAGDASYPLYFRLKLSAQTTGEHEGCATPELPEAEVVIGLMDE